MQHVASAGREPADGRLHIDAATVAADDVIAHLRAQVADVTNLA